eukprot:GFKZ01006024.1.p1 GENE.GFKZ01006024.1~~GFKZ01006024.1.p1  ORF type:complete len:574 (-),score=74.85 GFKZ01006024.1:1236-2957(-)
MSPSNPLDHARTLESPDAIPVSTHERQPAEISSLYQSASAKAEHYGLLGLHRTATFLADKAATASNSPQNTLRLARQFSAAGLDRRALYILQSANLQSTNAAARLLAAQCLYRLGQLEQCLAMLGGDEQGAPVGRSEDAIGMGLEGLSIEGEVGSLGDEIRAALCVLRARVYEKMENAELAVLWYKRALRCDLYCLEAFEGISENGLISKRAAVEFIKEITSEIGAKGGLAEFQRWVMVYYRANMDRSLPLPKLPGVDFSVDIMAVEAKRKYDALNFQACVATCRDILKHDPFVNGSILQTYLAVLVELEELQELFVVAHELVDREPRESVSWMAVGYYYFVSGKPDMARRFLQKATSLDARLAPAWVAYGHAFGAQDESDQAMAAYRTASRLFPGEQLPMLFMGMEYARQNSLGQASCLFRSALDACPSDPAPRHELGVIAYRMGEMHRAVAYFKEALSLWEASDGTKEVASANGRRAEAEEATLFNLGHCYRRLREFPRARRCYERSLGLRPRSASTCTALGMTLHAMRDMEAAVAMYHRALRYNPEDVTCGELLGRALEDMFLGTASDER